MRPPGRGVAMLLLLGSALIAGCGDSGGGGEEEPLGPLGLGEVCAGGLQCRTGFTCSRDLFLDQCSTECSTTAGCKMIDPRADCFGSTRQKCGLPCVDDGDCPESTVCDASLGACVVGGP